MDALHAIIYFLIGLALLQALVSFVSSFWTTIVGERILIDLRIQLYSHLQHLPLGFFQKNRTGELLSRLTNDVTLVRGAITGNIIELVQNVITLIVGFAIVITGPDTLLARLNQFNVQVPTSHTHIDFGPVLLNTAIILVPILVLPLIASRYLRRYVQKELNALSEATTASEEAIGSPKIVKAFTREDYEKEASLSKVPIRNSWTFMECIIAFIRENSTHKTNSWIVFSNKEGKYQCYQQSTLNTSLPSIMGLAKGLSGTHGSSYYIGLILRIC